MPSSVLMARLKGRGAPPVGGSKIVMLSTTTPWPSLVVQNTGLYPTVMLTGRGEKSQTQSLV